MRLTPVEKQRDGKLSRNFIFRIWHDDLAAFDSDTRESQRCLLPTFLCALWIINKFALFFVGVAKTNCVIDFNKTNVRSAVGGLRNVPRALLTFPKFVGIVLGLWIISQCRGRARLKCYLFRMAFWRTVSLLVAVFEISLPTQFLIKFTIKFTIDNKANMIGKKLPNWV